MGAASPCTAARRGPSGGSRCTRSDPLRIHSEGEEARHGFRCKQPEGGGEGIGVELMVLGVLGGLGLALKELDKATTGFAGRGLRAGFTISDCEISEIYLISMGSEKYMFLKLVFLI
jgi:hypothetical protein